jgi:hypothetical protein
MELADRTVMLLGGSGLVGHAMARRLLAATPPPPPRRLVLVALFEDEVRAAARALEPYRGSVTIESNGAISSRRPRWRGSISRSSWATPRIARWSSATCTAI